MRLGTKEYRAPRCEVLNLWPQAETLNATSAYNEDVEYEDDLP